ncbi:chromosome partitioning protein ParA [Photobacterium japonica]|uniref:AAA family ATPase n=1 Tax=Photobacterium japonica TaxID=2910235 RepID=UPI003D0D9518
MFDLAKAISKNVAPAIPVVNGPKSCTLIYQSFECLSLVEEIFLFEGWNEPTIQKEALKSTKLDREDLHDIILLELNQSSNVVEDARRFASQIPPHKGVIVIGKEDAISTLRALKDMGFYYVFWPVNKQELADFITHVNNNLQTFSGVSKQRKAKRVAIVGTKGGIGNTLITAELASVFSSQGTDTILVDHQNTDSNIDVLLSLKNLQRHNLTEMTMPLHELDDESAVGFLTNVRSNLRLLALEGGESDAQVLSFSQTLCQLLSRNANFILEDYSASVAFRPDPLMLVERSDVVIVVLEPSVASVRNARKLIEKLNNLQISDRSKVRVIPLLNIHRPLNSFALNKQEVEQYLQTPVAIELEYNRHIARLIIEGKRAHKHDKQMQQAFDELARLINGQASTNSNTPISWVKKVFNR